MEELIADIGFIAIFIVAIFIVVIFLYMNTKKREPIFERHIYYKKDPTYIIVSTVDKQKYTSTDQESMEKVFKLIAGKRIDKTKIENNTLQIYYCHGESVDVEIPGLTLKIYYRNGKRVDVEIKDLKEYYQFDNKK